MAAAQEQDAVPVVLDTAAGPVLARVDPGRYDVQHLDDGAVEVCWRDADTAPATGTLLSGEPPVADPSVPPLAGHELAVLRPLELALVADGWALDVRRARAAAGPDGAARLDAAAGQAAVLRALASDVPVDARPTWSQFVSATEAGLIGARTLSREVPAAPSAGTPLDAQLAQREQVRALVGGPREGFLPDEAAGGRSRPRAFAGLTVAAALVLTGCGSDAEAEDRRCVDADGTVVDDDLCDDDGGGVGGFFFIYGGSTYVRDGKTYVSGGSRTSPKGSFGSRSGSGGG